MVEDQTVEIAEIFHLLGDPTRLQIVTSCLNESRSVGEIADKVGISSSLTSHHLRLLKGARLVRSERRGKQVYYAAADEHIQRVLRDMMDHVAEPDSEGS
ncbi:MAG: winged helix-turn-helix transcriptional regulator [Alphaproteobacteria bacterium]|jgi:ArsR family transcriptional regulator, lead/cadmium/zinc/bismuth-responsive transcriptional repressor|nr:winged helix-turn-helix transcriptional regulator [Alphaproteobacteria bacterium]MBT7944167.1 winged helix-turn-helix transcriptional regulator [Alphaproteobacteria bacterium]